MELIFTNTELTTKKRRTRCRAQRIMMCHSNVVVQIPYSIYFLSKPIMFKKKSISSNSKKKKTESQTPHLKAELLHCFTSKTIITVSATFTLQTTLALSCDEHCGDLIKLLFFPFYRVQKKITNLFFLILPGPTAYGPKWDHPPPFPCTFLTLPCCTQGSCCILSSMITEVHYLDFYRQNGYVLYMEYTSLFVI